VRHKTDAAGIVFLARVVEAVGLGLVQGFPHRQERGSVELNSLKILVGRGHVHVVLRGLFRGMASILRCNMLLNPD
jgi:hypothetical protein